jgi:hypothetical protein
MFRQASGYKAQCGSLKLLVASDFDEWRVLALGSGTIIRGGREFSADKAKAQAVQIANEYFAENSEESSTDDLEWSELGPGEWLNWRP